jgi:hypothetical protein
VVPVIDLQVRFGRAPAAVGKKTCIVIFDGMKNGERTELGLMVDAVSEVVDIEPGQIDPPPSFGAPVARDFIRGMGRLRERLVILVDPARAFDVEEMAQICAASLETVPPAVATMPELSDPTFDRIARLMHGAVGLSFSPVKKPLISSRLSPRMHRLGIPSFEDYLRLIESNDGQPEFQMAVDLLTTNETYFFREPAHFELIERTIRDTAPASLQVWSAGLVLRRRGLQHGDAAGRSAGRWRASATTGRCWAPTSATAC